MRDVWDSWRKGARLAWVNLVSLIGLNLLWAVAAILVIPAGPATLAAYWWIARSLRDEDGEVRTHAAFFRGLRRFFWRGLAWACGWAATLMLAWAGLVVWPRFLPPLGVAIAEMAWLYALIYLAAMQPYLLEELTVAERPWGEALKVAAWQVLANPVYSHAQVLIPVAALALAVRFVTFLPLVLGALVLAFFAVAAQECPWKYGGPPPLRGRLEDVL